MSEHLLAPWSTLGRTVLAAVAVHVAVVALTRLSAARGLARMSSFDVASTVPALATSGISRPERWSQLRLARVHRLDLVRAVVVETTGDVSVITRDGPFDPVLQEGVRGAEADR
jgi:uncharacterized membrane protein YcaP (DUF421 family)